MSIKINLDPQKQAEFRASLALTINVLQGAEAAADKGDFDRAIELVSNIASSMTNVLDIVLAEEIQEEYQEEQ